VSQRLLALAALIATVSTPWPAHAWCRMTTSTRTPSASEPCILPDPSTDPPEQFLEWRRPCTAIAISVAAPSDDLTQAEVLGVLDRSLSSWEDVSCDGAPIGIEIGIFEETSSCSAPLYRDDGGNANTFMFVHDWADRMYDPAAFAVTTVWHRRSTGEILDVDMEMNERRGPYGICPPEGCASSRVVDLENVLTHEVGHYLGLAHTTDPEATMFASAVAGETLKRDLSADDIAGLCAVYPPGRPEGECDYTPRGGLVLHCDTGCSVATPGGSRSSVLGCLLALAALAFAQRRRG
jgi:hypothetical protein